MREIGLTFRGQLANVIYDLDKEFYCIVARRLTYLLPLVPFAS